MPHTRQVRCVHVADDAPAVDIEVDLQRDAVRLVEEDRAERELARRHDGDAAQHRDAPPAVLPVLAPDGSRRRPVVISRDAGVDQLVPEFASDAHVVGAPAAAAPHLLEAQDVGVERGARTEEVDLPAAATAQAPVRVEARDAEKGHPCMVA